MNAKSPPPLYARIGDQLKTNVWYQIGEILLVFAVALGFIQLMSPLAGDNPLLRQGVIWVANVLVLILIWLGLKIRGENWSDFGLTFKVPSWKEAIRIFLLSLLVLFFALMGFAIGSVIMANITGIPESADMSGYDYLKNNLGMFLLSLLGVYIVSSFGEEVIYRAFLITRISQMGSNSRNSRIIAIIISSIIFGLVHYSWGPMGIVQTTFMGLALGICYIVMKRRLWILILAHAYMDTLLLTQIYMASN